MLKQAMNVTLLVASLLVTLSGAPYDCDTSCGFSIIVTFPVAS